MKYAAPLLCLVLGLAAPPFALAETAAPSKAEDVAKAATDPAAFARVAASSNMLEIESSTLAMERSQNADVQAFAQKMIDDHTAAGEKMKAIAEDAETEVPAAMNDADMKALQALQDAQNFDQAYLELQVKAHEEAVALFDTFAAEGEGPLRDFAEETLPTLKDHQGHVRSLTGA
ncbi:DUF4142 domain-containing protein [Tabrizicola sp.]|uniref:DUF4142 domain-containing protein n=1 Tax=Tabrizicola sp. TaxID=2005166 RepID=UPI0035B352D1